MVTADGIENTIAGGFSNTATGSYDTIASGEYNAAGDFASFIGAGCNNVTGSTTAGTAMCIGGGEAILGGTAVTLNTFDGHSP
jgi:hypothetical protein